ncbi:MAG: J domain-containing protein [Variibacter sp.]
MKFDSPIFDTIRVKPDDSRKLRTSCPVCAWPGCQEPATHRAPKGRLREGQYWRFCLEHVREYNKTYNYFAGMSDDAVARYQKDALTGHRPTWKIGTNGSGQPGAPEINAAVDPLGMFREMGGRAGWQAPPEPPERERRMIRNVERKALDTLGLEIDATKAEIKTRFKMLVKRHHPDANGGDRTFEDRLRDIIQAYNYLKAAGYC